MNPVIKAQLKAFRKQHPTEDKSDEDLFEVFTAYAVLNGLLSVNVDPFDAHLSGSEFGLDGIAPLIQGDVCTDTDSASDALAQGNNQSVEFAFFQSKSGEKLDYGDLSKFFDAIYQFFTDSFAEPTDQLKDLMDVKDIIYESSLKKNPSLLCFFANTGTAQSSKQIDQLIDASKTRFEDLNIFGKIEIHIVGAKDLQAGYRSATNSISESVEILKPITLPEHPSVKEAFLGLVKAKDLVRLATASSIDSGERKINAAVFFDNVRDFDPDSEINKSILSEIKSGDQESFVFKNNGVTVVSKNIHRRGDKFDLEDYQIVNGCQTSNILFSAGDSVEEISVPFRLIGSDDPNFVSSIIVGTNKQNEIKEDQFWALKPFMKDLEEFCREQEGDLKLYIERRENQYRSPSVERTRIFKPSEITKSIVSTYFFQPHRAARGYRDIRKEYSKRFFLDGHDVSTYHASIYANYRFNFAVRNKRVTRDWNIYKFYFLFAIGFDVTNKKEIFSLKKSAQNAACEKILSICGNENDLVKYITRVAGILNSLIAASSLNSRERIRDYIRSPTAFEEFKSKI